MDSSAPGPPLAPPEAASSPHAQAREALSAATTYEPTGAGAAEGLLSDTSVAAMRSWAVLLEPSSVAVTSPMRYDVRATSSVPGLTFPSHVRQLPDEGIWQHISVDVATLPPTALAHLISMRRTIYAQSLIRREGRSRRACFRVHA